MKRKFFILISILLCLVIAPVTASAKVLTAQINVSDDKNWKIIFTKPIDSSTLDKNIVVTDSKKKSVNVSLQVSADKKTVSITPTTKYTDDESFTIKVKHFIKTTDGHYLKRDYSKHFTVKYSFVLTSGAFTTGSDIPDKYADPGVPSGQNISIPLSWSNAPDGTKSFALFMYDLNPVANGWVHWAVINIPATATGIEEGASLTAKMPSGCKELVNSYGILGYGGPCPPPGTGVHEYKFILYALDTADIDQSSYYVTYDSFSNMISGHILKQLELSGNFEQ